MSIPSDDYKVGKGHPPREHRFKLGHKAAVGHGPWKKSRSWNRVLKEMFESIQNDPDIIEKATGRNLPPAIRFKDAQFLVVMKELEMALRGDARAITEIKRWMDGDPKQVLDVQVGSVADLIREAQRRAKEATDGN
jgi:hypothetical protein